MKKSYPVKYYIFLYLLTLIFASSCGVKESEKETSDQAEPELEKINTLAEKPPMGWNSFDAYDCRINEEQFKAIVDVMANKLKPHGWEYAVVDYIWWHPEPGNWDTPRRKGHPNLRYNEDGSPMFPKYTTMDEFGRLMPAPERFPSAAEGKGFKPIADYVHSKGLKFGIHIMRGIHRYAAHMDTPIKGTDYSAKDIAEPFDTCGWCNHMYGVDASKPGAQEYYDSLFELYASWGVDYVKADDMTGHTLHEGELQLIRNAIENCGRPIVLSLSPGETPIGKANQIIESANLWRISADFWDNWESLRHNFDLLNAWSPHAGSGHWPDADMIPLGKLSLDDRPHGPERMSNFTEPEQYTLMNLWSMAKSPLMIGSDLLTTPDSILKFYQNDEVLYVNQESVGNWQITDGDESRIWIAYDPINYDVFLGLFNLMDVESEVSFDLEWANLRGTYTIRDLWKTQNIGETKNTLQAKLPPHGSVLYRLMKDE